jgi:hypothetical protein
MRGLVILLRIAANLLRLGQTAFDSGTGTRKHTGRAPFPGTGPGADMARGRLPHFSVSLTAALMDAGKATIRIRLIASKWSVPHGHFWTMLSLDNAQDETDHQQ